MKSLRTLHSGNKGGGRAEVNKFQIRKYKEQFQQVQSYLTRVARQPRESQSSMCPCRCARNLKNRAVDQACLVFTENLDV